MGGKKREKGRKQLSTCVLGAVLKTLSFPHYFCFPSLPDAPSPKVPLLRARQPGELP